MNLTKKLAHAEYTPKSIEMIVPQHVNMHVQGKSAVVVIDDRVSIKLDHRNPVSTQLLMGVDSSLLSSKFADARYFVVDDQCVDYATDYSRRNVFTHTEDSINRLIEHVGFSMTAGGRIRARRQVNSFNINPLNKEVGGEFSIHNFFNWSPFNSDVVNDLEIMRMVCENLAIAQSPYLTHRIPVINDWTQNIEIANSAVSHSVHSRVAPRLVEMTNESVLLSHVVRMVNAIELFNRDDRLVVDPNQTKSLRLMAETLQPFLSVSDSMQNNAKSMVSVSAVKSYDLMNIATEITSHVVVNAHDKNGDTQHTRAHMNRFQAIANDILFTDSSRRTTEVDVRDLITDNTSFGNVNQAFHAIAQY